MVTVNMETLKKKYIFSIFHKKTAVVRLAQPNGIKHVKTPLGSLNTDEKCKREEEEGAVNSLFRSQVLRGT